MVIIKCDRKGYLTGFDDNDNPSFGEKLDALILDVNTANDLCFELEDHSNPSISTVDVGVNKMVIIKCDRKGYLTGFDDNDNPSFGEKLDALILDVNTANDLCFELEDHSNPSISIVNVGVNNDYR